MGYVPRNAASNLELILASFLLLLKAEEVEKNAFEAEAKGIHPGLIELSEWDSAFMFKWLLWWWGIA